MSTAGQPVERRLVLSDGAELFYRAWLPEGRPRAGLVLVHRGHEHSGRFAGLVQALGLTDTAVFAWDARGHGRSPGDRGYAPSFARVIRDLDEFVGHVCRSHGLAIEDVIALGHSVGAVAVAAWVHDYAPRIRAMVLVTPALRVRLYVPLAVPGLRLLHALRRGRRTFVTSYVRGRLLTHDAAEARAYDDDPLIGRAIAVNVLLDLHDTATRLIEDAAAIRTPTLVLSAGSDWVVSLEGQTRFFQRLGSPDKQLRVFTGMYHDVLHEADRHLALAEIRRFVLEAWSRAERPAPLLDADQRGPTRDEYARLAAAPGRLGPRRLGFAVLRGAMKSLGRLSAGIRLGWRTGFDSGQSLDYVYQDRARGALGVGRWLDRIYLDSPGWRGVRQRRANLRALLVETIGRLAATRRPVRVVDIASGPGRYVLEAVAGQDAAVAALLRDRDPANLDAARDLAKGLGLTDVACQVADAFDAASLAAIAPPPDIAVVSGLYELVPDNARVRASLHGLAKALGGGGYLIYTGQPWHPQLELIARVLRNRDGRPWVMRRRTQEELDDLVRAAGFEKVETRIDEAGIFTVSVARIGAVPVVTDAGLTRALEDYFRLMSMNGAVHVYRAALRAGVLDALREEAKGSARVAQSCGLAERPVALLLPALAELGLVSAGGDDAWELTPLAHALLAGSYRELGDLYWSHLATFLRTDTPMARMDSPEESEAQYQAQAAALAWMQAPAAEAAASALGAEGNLGAAEILDVGAGSAIWSLTVARHAAGARVTAVDWPAVLSVAVATAERLGLAERLALRPGSYHEVELPLESFDLAFLANVTHLETPAGNRALLGRLRRALKPAGRLAIVDVLPGLPAGDLSRALYALGLALRTERGRVYTPAELGALLAETGFGPARLVNLDAPPYVVGMLVASPV